MINLFTNLRWGLALVVLSTTGNLAAQAQGVGIGTTAPAASAVLDVASTTQGQLLPRMTAAQRAAIANPVVGLFVFQTDGSPGLYYYINHSWMNLVNGLEPDADGNAGASTTTQVSTVAGFIPGFVDGANSNAQMYANGTSSVGQLNGPDGVVQDSYFNSSTLGHYYVADTRNNSIRVISPTRLTTVAGNGSWGDRDGTGIGAQFRSPGGVALSSNSTILYVSDTGSDCIRQINLSTGGVSHMTGASGTSSQGYHDGSNSFAKFRTPSGIIMGTGFLYRYLLVADRDNNCIRKVDPNPSGLTGTLVGNSTAGFVDGTGTAARFNGPTGVAMFDNILYVADAGNHCIRKITSGPGGGVVVTTLAGNGAAGANDGTGVVAQFNDPNGVAVDKLGNVYVADTGNNRIRKITAMGVVTTLAGSLQGNTNGTAASAQFNKPSSLIYDSKSKAIIVTDRDNNCIRMIQ